MARPILPPGPPRDTARLSEPLALPARWPRWLALPRLGSLPLLPVAVLWVALLQGLLYLVLLPPWQHYDEPTHLEFGWLIANHNHIPQAGQHDQSLRRDLAGTMLGEHFYEGLPQPNWLTDSREIWVGVSELDHPPAYYLLLSLPLRLVSHLDLISQLYVARLLSLLLFLLTVAVALGLMRDLTPPGSPLRWAVPLGLALLPSFVDVMTSVNNDVAVVPLFSLFLWGAVRTIRWGLNWRRGLWVVGTALLAVFTKNTGAVAVLLLPLVFGLTIRRPGLLRLLLAGLLAGLLALLPLLFAWGDAAAWYRRSIVQLQEQPTQAAHPQAPVGRHVLRIDADTTVRSRSLVAPLLYPAMPQLAGQTVTVGGWVWADRAAQLPAFGLLVGTDQQRGFQTVTRPLTVTTEPTFYAWTQTLPADLDALDYLATASLQPADQAPLRLYLDGVVLAVGSFPAGKPPQFSDEQATAGSWAGRPFTNLVRNASAEQAGPRMQVWFDRMIIRYAHRSPSQTLTALFDVERVLPLFIGVMVMPTFDSLAAWFAWGNIRLPQLWIILSRVVGLLALAGALRWLYQVRATLSVSLRRTLSFLALVTLLAWLNTLLRPLPLLEDAYVIPIARYAFPAIIPTMCILVGGWATLWPRRWRQYGIAALLVGLLILNIVAASTIWAFFHGLASA